MRSLLVAGVLISVALTTGLTGCGGGDDGQGLEGPRWVLAYYATADGSMADALATPESDATFADGTVQGSGGINMYHGAYELEGDALTVSPLAYTKMAGDRAVMDQESTFLAALQSAVSYEVDGDKLVLRDGAGKTSLEFRAAAD